MKRICLFILCLALLFIFPGCQNNDPVISTIATTQPTEAPTSAPTESEEETQPTLIVETASQQPMFSVYVPVTTQEFAVEDGTVIYTHTYQDMKLTMPDPDVANKIIIDFLNRVDNGGSSADLLATAGSEYTGSTDWIPYTHSTIYSPKRIDQGILSLYGSSTTYDGSSHPTHISISANYDMITGNYLTLGSILASDSASEQLYELLIQTLDDDKEENQLYPAYETVVQDLLLSDPDTCGNWYFSWDGICFYFSPYEIAPYASGVIEVQIPYSQLLGILKDEYFPPEYSHAGTVQAILFEDADTTKFTQICEVNEDPNGQKVLLYSGDTAVSHVTLTHGIFEESGVATLPNYTLFACSTLTPGDAILLEVNIPDTMPNLQLQYQSGEEYITKYISQSGMDGSILLLD